jgi:hypothetical protein
MHAALRPYITAGIALVGASVIAVTPVTPSLPSLPVEQPATRLLASSIANIPLNLVIMAANIPYYQSLAIQEYAYALGPAGATGGVPGWIPPGTQDGGVDPGPDGVRGTADDLYASGGTGSWYMQSIGNTWGWDNGNWPQLAAILHFFLPFAFTLSLAEQLQIFAQAELPDGSGVNCEFQCADLWGYLVEGWLSPQVPLTALLSGTTFPTYQTNTMGQDSPTGIINVGPPGAEQVAIWSGEPAQLNPLAPLQALAANLTADPADNPIMLPDPATLIESVIKLSNGINYTGFNPFVQGSFLYWGAPTLYSVPAAIGGLVQTFTGIPNQFLIPPWQPNGREPITGYTASLPQLVEGLPQGFEYLLRGLLGYVSPTLAADLSGPLDALGNLGTVPAKLLESTDIPDLWLLATTAAPMALANLNTQVAQFLSSLVSGLDGGSLSSLVNNLSGTTSTVPAAVSLNTTDAPTVLGTDKTLPNPNNSASTVTLSQDVTPAVVGLSSVNEQGESNLIVNPPAVVGLSSVNEQGESNLTEISTPPATVTKKGPLLNVIRGDQNSPVGTQRGAAVNSTANNAPNQLRIAAENAQSQLLSAATNTVNRVTDAIGNIGKDGASESSSSTGTE